MPVQIIEHKGKEIIFVDHKGLQGSEMIDCFKEASREILARKGSALSLADFSGANLTKDFIEYLKTEEVKEITGGVKKEAIIGVSGIKKMVYNIYSALSGSTARVFNTIEEAKDYLVT